LGIFDVFKKSRREVNRENQRQGKAGEDQIKDKYKFNGYDVKRTGKGHDLKATKKNFWTGKKETKYIEVKTGKSKLSPLQKKKKSQMGKKYVVERLEPTMFGLTSTDPDLKKKRKSKKKSDSLFGSTDSLFGSTKKKRSTKKSDSLFGSTDSLFGSTKKKRKSKKKSDDWGLGF